MATVFINEIHYDNAGTDTGEAIEIAGPAGTILDGWSLVLYNGSGGAVYDTDFLTGTIPNQQNGFGTVTITYPSNGIQNGSPDGIALVDNNGAVVQFLSYEGTFTAVGGPANGLNSTDIGVQETGSVLEPPGLSLQLTGAGDDSGDFTFSPPADDSFGAVNVGQTFNGSGGAPTITINDVTVTEGNAGTTNATFTVSRSGDVNGSTTVDFATTDGTATANSDYNTTSGTLSFAAGETTKTINVPVQGDTLDEDNENFFVNLSNASDNATIADRQGEGTITNDDTPPPPITRIYDIQGAAQTSTLVGDRVTTEGIVTAVDSSGFYLQDPTGDTEIATSDAIFVFTSSRPIVAVGDELRVGGLVSEFTPGGAATRNLSTTQISGNPTITRVSTGNDLPAAVTLGQGGRVPPTENIDDDAFGSFDPTADGIDFFESLEAMRVTAQDLVAVSGTNQFGEIFGVVDSGDNATGLSNRGTLNISPDDFNPERIQIQEDTGILPDFTIPQVDTGAFLDDVTGVVSYDFGNFQIQPTQEFTATDSPLQPEDSALDRGPDQLTVASYNVLNLDPNDGDGDTDVADGRFNAIAAQIANNLNSPDIIGLQEIQDNDGSVNSDVTAANLTLETLRDAITAADGPVYEFIDNRFIGDDTNGGQPGGNIRTAFLYNPERVDLVEDSVRPVTNPEDQQTNPDNPFFDSRPPLVADFEFNGQTVTVIDNHFSSKGGSAPILGTEQPFEERQEDPSVNGSLDERRAQAQAVNEFVKDILVDNSNANVVVQGDLNEFEFISPLDEILEENLTNLTKTLPEDERYSFNFQGNSQALDHILVSRSLADGAEFDEVHVNSEFAATDQRASDHDPLLSRFTLADPANVQTGTDGDDILVASPQRDIITAVAGNDRVIARYSELQQNDSIDGGDGRDTFVLNDGVASNSVTIAVADPNDQLQGPNLAAVTNFEVFNLTNFEGSATFIGSDQGDVFRGGAGDDTATGNGGNDTLSGGGGNNTLRGGAGNDTYILNSTNDQVLEDSGAGIDSVRAYASFTLPANVENLTLLGGGASSGTGNARSNTIIGNGASNTLRGDEGIDTLLGQVGNDRLIGDQGADTLMGGVGADRFVFNSRNEGIDTITDFSPTVTGERIEVSNQGFGGGLTPGDINPDQFRTGTRAGDASDRFIYTRSTGGLFFDQDGTGSAGKVQFATLDTGLNLTSDDIFVIA